MKKIMMFSIYICLSMLLTSSSGIATPTADTPTPQTAHTSTPGAEDNYNEYDMTIKFGLTINSRYYPIPWALKQYLNDGWIISDRTPYFLHPMVSEDYYEMRANFSLTKDGRGIYPGGSIIRLLEKEGVMLEVTITNQEDEKIIGIEDGVVDSITVFYDDTHTSIQLNGMELSSLTPEILLSAYPGCDGWTHSPSNYSNHPEFGISTDYYIYRNLDNCNRTISIYFDLDNTAFKITITNQTPLKFYSE